MRYGPKKTVSKHLKLLIIKLTMMMMMTTTTAAAAAAATAATLVIMSMMKTMIKPLKGESIITNSFSHFSLKS